MLPCTSPNAAAKASGGNVEDVCRVIFSEEAGRRLRMEPSGRALWDSTRDIGLGFLVWSRKIRAGSLGN